MVLLSKSIFHIVFFVNRQLTPMQVCQIIYVFLSSKSSVFLSFILYSYISYKIKVGFLYSFNLKLTVSNIIFLNVILATLYSGLNQIFKISFNVCINTFHKKHKLYTVLRSPFIFKKTREQFIITTNKATIFFNVNTDSNLLVEYLVYLL
jgi:hypothetical protein